MPPRPSASGANKNLTLKEIFVDTLLVDEFWLDLKIFVKSNVIESWQTQNCQKEGQLVCTYNKNNNNNK